MGVETEMLVYFQELVQKSIDETEKAVRMVNELNLFATNEEIDEIATSDLRFPLVFALLHAISPSLVFLIGPISPFCV